MKEFVISEAQVETAVLVGLITKTQDERKTNEYLDELAFLAETAGAEVVKRFTQKLDQANSVTYVGKGKLEEIKEYIRSEEEAEREIGMVIFDDELSAKQIRNIEAELKIKILDRTSLILDIFAMRAQTANAKTQVELAQYKYMLPRLQRLWTHLERQGGGSGAGGGKGSVGLRGPGETQLEMDRRIILNRMSLLKDRLAEIDKQKATQRKNRGRLIRVALVGYTNVGKSTLMTLLSKSEVFAENKLFATLDTTVRKVIIENLPFLLSDTVGFIRKLPTDLVDSFKSTLDEVREADLLLHIVDISHPDFEEQIEVVNKTLADIVMRYCFSTSANCSAVPSSWPARSVSVSVTAGAYRLEKPRFWHTPFRVCAARKASFTFCSFRAASRLWKLSSLGNSSTNLRIIASLYRRRNTSL